MKYATNNLELFHMRYGALIRAGLNPKWYAKFYGKTEIYFIQL